MWLKWLPWRLVVSRVARAHGFLDPMTVLARLHRFAQPSEVAEPIELLRAGVVFHARGLINSRAIQHNLDWVWPSWVERQFDPDDAAFVPRAFSLTHINLTHRNWTAVGLPDLDWLPIVDPRGLVTPHFDGWSIDVWVLGDDGRQLLPSRAGRAEQTLGLGESLAVRTTIVSDAGRLEHTVDVLEDDTRPCCRVRVAGRGDGPGWLAVAIRPSNPEGVSFVHEVERIAPNELRVNDEGRVVFDVAPERLCMSDYARGDVYGRLESVLAGVGADDDRVTCDVGLASAAAMFRLGDDRTRAVELRLPAEPTPRTTFAPAGDWPGALAGACGIEVPDARVAELFENAIASMILHAPDLVYPGPFTYRRFWFRDAAFILAGLLAAGIDERVGRVIERFPEHQTPLGYFHSQDGEWDSNGESLWIIDRYHRHAGRPLSPDLQRAVRRGANWIVRKRLHDDDPHRHAGLMPAGFSAEHLGPNDFYYWDDFWSAAGLRAAADIFEATPDHALGDGWREQADRLMEAVERSLEHPERDRRHPGIPASPYRRMDAGAIGSLAVGYPLQLWSPRDTRLLATTEHLLEHCTVGGGFFQDMIHSGINAYLTLHLAQVLLRAGEGERAWTLVETVRDLASPTGQWPEAIHPRTRGGCMGDGQHLWAAAEWVLMVRNCFVREEEDGLVVGSGIPRHWLASGGRMRLGPTPTPFGRVTVELEPDDGGTAIRVTGEWRDRVPRIDITVADAAPTRLPNGATSIVVPRGERHPGGQVLTGGEVRS